MGGGRESGRESGCESDCGRGYGCGRESVNAHARVHGCAKPCWCAIVLVKMVVACRWCMQASGLTIEVWPLLPSELERPVGWLRAPPPLTFHTERNH